jgi:quinol monooxygenase YgiN
LQILARLLGASVFLASFSMNSLQAQVPAPPDGPRYVVTYIEVLPTAKSEGVALVRQFRDAMRREDGNLRAEAARRISSPNQFLILETWKDQKSLDAHGKSAASSQFHDRLKAIQIAPYDERVHYPLSVGPIPANLGGAAVLFVTHVDVIPPRKDDGTALVKQFGDDSRKEDGNLRFEVVTQTNRPNHFSMIEGWRNRKAADAHSMSARNRAFRAQLAPMSGALFDQRVYKVLN